MVQFDKDNSIPESNLKWYQRLKLWKFGLVVTRIDNFRLEQKIIAGNAIALLVFVSLMLLGIKVGEYTRSSVNRSYGLLQSQIRLLNELGHHSLALQKLVDFPPADLQTDVQVRDSFLQRVKRTRYLIQVVLNFPTHLSDSRFNLWLRESHNSHQQFLLQIETILNTSQNFRNELELRQQLRRTTQESLPTHRQLVYQLSQRIEQLTAASEIAEKTVNQGNFVYLLLLICFFCLSLLVTSYISLRFSQKLLKPIIDINHQIQNILTQMLTDTGEIHDISQIDDDVSKLRIMLDRLREYINYLHYQNQTLQAEIEKIADAKTRFLANISHELRTPLNGILGYAQIMMRSPDLNPEQQRGITTIYNCGSHLLDLVNDILDFSKLETDNIELNPVDFQFPSFCQRIVETCRVQAEQKGLKLIYNPSFNLPIGINADKNRLRQVMTNLISYAIKSTNQGYVKLTIQAFPYPRNQNNQVINIKISKTDGGLTNEQIQSLFSPFENVYNHQPKGDEPGFAIALSQKILQKMGSTLKIKSKIPTGSVFSFALICEITHDWTENSTINSSGKIVGYTGEKKKILIVDDNWKNRSILISLLEPLKFMIFEADNGNDALQQAEVIQPDLIISDMGMPIMDGWELAAKIRCCPHLSATKFILSSHIVMEYEQNMTTHKGVDAFLSKPINTDELYQVLNQQLGINWIYANHTIEDTNVEVPGEISIPPFPVIASLVEFAKRGQIRGIQDELIRIEALDPSYGKFVKKLREYTQTFNIQKIRDFLAKNVRN